MPEIPSLDDDGSLVLGENKAPWADAIGGNRRHSGSTTSDDRKMTPDDDAGARQSNAGGGGPESSGGSGKVADGEENEPGNTQAEVEGLGGYFDDDDDYDDIDLNVDALQDMFI